MPSFEDSLKKLESIVDQLEKGDLASGGVAQALRRRRWPLRRLQGRARRRRGQSPDAGQTARRLA